MILILSGALLLGGCSCFNTEEDPEQVKVEDSLAEIDRSESLDEADRLLREADSLEQLKQDSIAAAQQGSKSK